MQVNGPFDSIARGGLRPAAALARSVEKSSASSDLGTHQQDTAKNPGKLPPRLQVELVCQDETVRFDPFWDGPRLKPAFVAQLLGQVMPDAHKSMAAQTVYGAAVPRAARLVDRTS